jgi:hypothetical protein
MIKPGQIYRTISDELVLVEEVTATHVMWRWMAALNSRLYPCLIEVFLEDIDFGLELVEDA